MEEKAYRLGLGKRSEQERTYIDDLEEVYGKSPFTNVEKLMNFPMFVPRQDIASFIYKYELFQKVLHVHGSIVECGVAFGGGLMAFAQFSAIFEPVNHIRRVIGFDTFSGFPRLSDKDVTGGDPQARAGGMSVDSYDELQKFISLFDENRFLGHLPKVELVKGDVLDTIPAYIEENPHTVVALLYLDLDLYEPTVAAIKHFLPRMPKGAVIGFDEVAHPDWAGETLAVLEEIGINNLRIQRVPFDSTRSYAVLE